MFAPHLLVRRTAPPQSLMLRCLRLALETGYRREHRRAKTATTRTVGARSDPGGPQILHDRGQRAAPGTDHEGPLASSRPLLLEQEKRASALPEASSLQ